MNRQKSATMRLKNGWPIISLTIAFGIVIFLVALIIQLASKIDPTSSVGILGVAIGALAGILGAAASASIAAWTAVQESQERLKDRVSAHALELTRMDYELRQKSLQLSKQQQNFLAPIKVYREVYKALLELHDEGTWPSSINELGLLSIFPLGSEDTVREAKNSSQT